MSRQKGIALVLVLWVSALMSLLAASYAFGVRTETYLMGDLRARAEAKAVAEAAVVFFGVALANEEQRKQIPLNGASLVWEFSGHEIEVQIVDASGLIDLNRAPREELKRAFAWAGMDPDYLDAAVDNLIDWRDSNDLPQLNGAEDEDYFRAGLFAGAKDAPFEAVEELGQVMGFDAEVVERLMTVTTVNGARNVNPNAAPDRVLDLLSSGSGVGDPILPDGDGGEGDAQAFHIYVNVFGVAGQQFGFTAVVDPAIGQPARILAWRE